MKYTKTRIILLACVCASINGDVRDPETLREALPGYAITANIDQLNSTRCRTEVKEFRDSVDRGVLWSLRMLDASGEPTSGFVSGNNYWMGSRQQCEFLSQKRALPLSDKRIRNNSIYRNPVEEFPPFQLNFFSAHISQNGTVQYHISVPKEELIVLGLCLPASCTEHEVATMLTKMFDDRLLLIGQLYSTDFKLIKVSNLKNDHKWLLSGKIITILFILTALFGIVIMGTLYDSLVYQKCLRKKKESLAYENNNTSELKNDMEEKREHDQEDDIPSEIKPDNRIVQILIHFSAYSNIKQIFKIDNGVEDIAVFHGLKFFGMIWITMAHTVFYTLHIIGNKAEGYMMTINVENQILSNATLSVDTFLFISGFLLTFAYLKMQGKKEKKVVSLRRNAMNFISALVKRYIRLTPAYLTTILLVIINFSWHEQFTLWYFIEPMPQLCSKYWWRNILYINNLFEWEDLCLSWSWYLSNDMQFYIYGIFLLILSTSYYYAALGISVATLLFSTFMRAYVTYATGYIATLDAQLDTMTYIYMRPWMRIQPYIVGMGTALLLTKLNYKLNLSKKALAACWCFSISCNCTILFSVVDGNISLGLSMLYQMFSRLGWSVGIGWLVIACVTNNAGIVGKFLSLRYWIPFSRVTYCAYLINPFLILSISMFSNYSYNIDFLTTGVIALGILVITYVCAFALSIMAEVPAILFLRSISTSSRRMKRMKYKRISIVLLACVCLSTEANVRNSTGLVENFPGYTITNGIEQLNLTKCRKEMDEYRVAVNDRVLWSLRMLDASGQPTSGFISGNNFWMGSRQQCKYLSEKIPYALSKNKMKNNSIYRNPNEEFPPFQLNFFSVQAHHNGTMQYHVPLPMDDVIALGLCLPASCSEQEVATMMKKVFDDRLLLLGQLYSMDFTLIKVSSLKDDFIWLHNGKMIVILLILVAYFGIATVATLYDILIFQKRLEMKKKKKKKGDENLKNTIEFSNDAEAKAEGEIKDIPSELKRRDRIEKILICFSVYSNIKQIFEMGNNSTDIAIIHGMKFFAMILTISGHGILYAINNTGNKMETYVMASLIETQIFSNTTLSVDTFLFISAFLQVHGFLKMQTEEKKREPFRKKMIDFFNAIIKRYIRLTPVYVVTILLVIVTFSWLANYSVAFFSEPMHELCSKYWWKNLLYINNFSEWKDICMSWSWYVSNDMQFYIVGLLLLTLSTTSYRYTALSLGIGILLVTTLVHAYITYDTGYIPTVDTKLDTLTTMYIKPWMRIQPYMIGMGTALLLNKWNYKLHLSKKASAACWTLSIFSTLAIMFGCANPNMTLGLSVVYETFSRIVWSLGIAWLIIACLTNNGGIVNEFLRLPYWIPPSRVTYTAYLFNPFIVITISTFSNYPFNVEYLTSAVFTIGICTVTYVVSFGLSAIIEVPTIIFLRTVSSSSRRKE
ncbi:uncharacterized protein LOC117610687 [Osmia lignaria lignaria]|uniref:uncharacterized protein LOC117610687 n=1 Tax=Osmia lignaria lignaria TaxID=1437193 RepID=UPI00402B2CC5